MTTFASLVGPAFLVGGTGTACADEFCLTTTPGRTEVWPCLPPRRVFDSEDRDESRPVRSHFPR